MCVYIPVYVCMCVHMTLDIQHTWRSEDSLWELAVPYRVVSWD